MSDRRDELAANLQRVRERIAAACEQAGRDPGEVTLTVVTKLFPASDVRILAELGVRHFGENRHQEAVAKVRECADLDLVWHFIGSVQSNKAAAVAEYADVVESVDRGKLLSGLSRGAHRRGGQLDCLVQVSLDPAPTRARGGAPPHEVAQLARTILAAEGLRLRGVMAIAPLGGDPRPAFERLAGIAAEIATLEPSARWISAGMSGDFEAAVICGATHVRVGSAVLGERAPLR